MPRDQEREPVLAASVHDVRYFTALLRGINFANRATVIITQSGFTITVEEARAILATAFVFKDVFDEYSYHPVDGERPPSLSPETASQAAENANNATFEVQLNTLIDCLNVFGSAGVASFGAGHKKWRRTDGGSDRDDDGREHDHGGRIEQYFSGSGADGRRTGMRMKYQGTGYPLTLLLAEDSSGPTTTCEITTFNSEPQLELPFDSSRTVLKIILKSSWLREALSEIDPSCEKLTIVGHPPPEGRARAAQPILRLQAKGNFGSTEMDYPNDREVVETVECAAPVRFSYRFGHVTRALRALQSSSKTSLRIDSEGLLSLQFLMPRIGLGGRAAGSDAFIEFRCLALDEDVGVN